MNKEFKPNTRVLERLAGAFYENESLKKTQLFFISRTNWKSFDNYVIWLKIKNYIGHKTDGKDERYYLTDTGREMFDTVLKFHEHVRSSKTIIMFLILGFVYTNLDDMVDFVA